MDVANIPDSVLGTSRNFLTCDDIPLYSKENYLQYPNVHNKAGEFL
jgi:hypothetical protein